MAIRVVVAIRVAFEANCTLCGRAHGPQFSKCLSFLACFNKTEQVRALYCLAIFFDYRRSN